MREVFENEQNKLVVSFSSKTVNTENAAEANQSLNSIKEPRDGVQSANYIISHQSVLVLQDHETR